MKKCQKTDASSDACGDRGIELEHVEIAVMESLLQHEKELLKMPARVDEPDISQLKESLEGHAPLSHAERLQQIEALNKAPWETIDVKREALFIHSENQHHLV